MLLFHPAAAFFQSMPLLGTSFPPRQKRAIPLVPCGTNHDTSAGLQAFRFMLG
jgi:hypothetical protein